MINKMFRSLKHSISGLQFAYNIDKTIKLEFILTLPVIILIFIFFEDTEIYVLILLWFFIIIVELINTVIEKTIDSISKDESIIIKKIKDISSAAVFLSVMIFLLSFIYFLL